MIERKKVTENKEGRKGERKMQRKRNRARMRKRDREKKDKRKKEIFIKPDPSEEESSR